jgi:hypothetical protein
MAPKCLLPDSVAFAQASWVDAARRLPCSILRSGTSGGDAMTTVVGYTLETSGRLFNIIQFLKIGGTFFRIHPTGTAIALQVNQDRPDEVNGLESALQRLNKECEEEGARRSSTSDKHWGRDASLPSVANSRVGQGLFAQCQNRTAEARLFPARNTA